MTATVDEIFKTMNYYWSNMHRKCEEYVKQSYDSQADQSTRKVKSCQTYLNNKIISKVSGRYSRTR